MAVDYVPHVALYVATGKTAGTSLWGGTWKHHRMLGPYEPGRWQSGILRLSASSRIHQTGKIHERNAGGGKNHPCKHF